MYGYIIGADKLASVPETKIRVYERALSHYHHLENCNQLRKIYSAPDTEYLKFSGVS